MTESTTVTQVDRSVRRKRWASSLGAVILLATAAWALRRFDWSPLRSVTLRDYSLLSALVVAQNAVGAASSLMVLRSLGHRAPYLSVLTITQASVTANYAAPGRLGMPARAVWQLHLLGVPLSVSTAGMVLETGVGLVYGGVVAVWSAMALLGGVGGLLAPLAALLGMVMVMVWLGVRRADRAAASDSPRGGYLGPIVAFFGNVRRAMATAQAATLWLTAVPWCAAILLTWWRGTIAMSAVGGQVDAIRLLQCMVLAYFAGQLSMIPMGLGAKDASLVALLGKSGVPAHTAIAFAALDRVATTGLTLVIGAICAGILGLKRGRQVVSP